MRLLTALLVRNEAAPDRYLRRVLARCRALSDFLLVLDDRSTDDTAAICRAEGAWVETRQSDTPAWGAESQARQELWTLAVEATSATGAWVLFCDADMLLSADPRPLCNASIVNTWCWPLYDVWGDGVYRADPPWQGHRFPRAWMVKPDRVPDGWVPEWGTRGLHVGHLPENWPMIAGRAPATYYWEHLAYATPGHRAQKYVQYLSRRDQLLPHEIAHAESILDG